MESFFNLISSSGAISWISSVFTSSVITSSLAFIFGIILKSKIETKFRLYQEKKMEDFKANIREKEEYLKSEIRLLEQKNATLYQIFSSRQSNRLSNLDKRKLQAVENIWKCACSLENYKRLSISTQSLKMEAILRESQLDKPNSEKYRKFIKKILEIHGLSDPAPLENADIERPFLNEISWAYFSLYKSSLIFQFSQLLLSSVGQGNMIKNYDDLANAAKKLLPEHSNFIQKNRQWIAILLNR